MNEARIWLVYSREHEAWWRPASDGYTTSIAEAGRYTKAEAARHCTSVDRMLDGQTKEFAHLAPEVADRIEELERDVTVTWPTRVAKCGVRIAELEAIVEKLPRMEDGALWCMTDDFWFMDNDGKVICDRTRDFTLKELANFIDGEWGPCFSTRAAAEAAKEGATK